MKSTFQNITGSKPNINSNQAPGNTQPAESATPQSQGYLRILLPLTAMVLLIQYVETMLLPGIPVIQNYFSTTEPLVAWITTASLIAGVAISPLAGKLGDFWGKKNMILVVLIFYVAGVGIAGFSTSIYVLLFARALQGIGFAMTPLSLAIIADTFPKDKMATAQGIIGVVAIIGLVIGFVVGALIIQDLGWRYAFYTSFVLSLALFGFVVKVIKKDPLCAKGKVDYIGVTTLSAGIVLALLYLTEGPSLGWFSVESLALLTSGVIFTCYFFVYENKTTNPLIQLSVLRIRNVLVPNLVGLVSSIATFIITYATIYYAELPKPFGLGIDVISTGLMLVPAALVTLVAAPIVGKIVTRSGPKSMLFAGSFVMILGFVLIIVARFSVTGLAAAMVCAYAGIIILSIPTANMLAISLPRDSSAVGQGVNQMLKSLGSGIGPILATVIMASLTAPLVSVIGGQTVVVGHLPSSMAFNVIAIVGLAVMAVVMVICLATENYIIKSPES